MRDKIYYIADTYGTYYKVTSSNKLLAVNKKEWADKLPFLKANNVLQNAVKPSNRYQYVLVEADVTPQENRDELLTNISKEDLKKTRFDELDTDWLGCLEDVLSFISQLQQYKCNLSYMYSEVEKEICDIMHYVEFNSLDAANGCKVYKMLRDCRLRRRLIKDENIKVTAAIEALGDLTLQEKLKESICRIKNLDNRQYSPRVLEELFYEAS